MQNDKCLHFQSKQFKMIFFLKSVHNRKKRQESVKLDYYVQSGYENKMTFSFQLLSLYLLL